ncbi:hypothetical protein FKM82_028408 [Ascaphus truei]
MADHRLLPFTFGSPLNVPALYIWGSRTSLLLYTLWHGVQPNSRVYSEIRRTYTAHICYKREARLNVSLMVSRARIHEPEPGTVIGQPGDRE